jgi:uncharacterized ion transporter superfamily protein YfcC
MPPAMFIWLLLLETSVLYLFLYISKLLSYNRVTRSRKSNKDRQPNDKKKNRQMNTTLQHKTKDRAIRTPLIYGVNSGAPEG